MPSPRVTLGIATYERDTYLAEAIASCLAQDYDDYEVLVVLDGGRNPRVDEIVASFDDPRLRVVRHDVNKGIAEAYNTIVREGRGELIGILGDDDVAEPGRLRRSVAVFDRHPDTGVVHGDATIIDAAGRETGRWTSGDFTPSALLELLVRRHNYLIDPTRLVHRRVYEAVGGYRSAYRLAQDFDFWLRAAPRFRFRHVEGGPLIRFRRHGENGSDESQRGTEIADVEGALREAFDAIPLRTLVPELDWDVVHPLRAERRAWATLADALEKRELPLPGLAAELRERAAAVPAPPKPMANGRKIMLTSFGFEDSGGGTTVPRMIAKELVNRGWEVTVFHAAAKPHPTDPRPYAISEAEVDGVHLIGVHNRAHGLWDLKNPMREVDDPPITAAFAQALDRVRPDVVHVHNLHNLGGALLDEIHARGLPAYFSTHNYWLVCPRGYLIDGNGAICPGPGDGTRCASCAGGGDPAAFRIRNEELRSRFTRGIDVCLAVSHAMKRTLVAQGFPAEMLDVVQQAVPAADAVWERVGRDRTPGRLGDKLTVAFFGSAYPHKGPQLLVEAAQRTGHELRVILHGEVQPRFAAQLKAMDRRGVVEVAGGFSPSELPGLLADVDVAVMPSLWWDCAPLAAAECLAGRVPLVAPRLGGLGEAVRHEVDGLLFEGLDAGSLAEQLDRLAGEAGLLERLQAGIEAPRPFAAYVDELEAYYAGRRPSQGVGEAGRPVAADWVGDHNLKTSLSTINREVAARLPEDVRVRRVERNGVVLDAPLPHAADVEVRHQWPPDFSVPASGRLALIQPWEFGALPAAWIEPLRETVDEVWVPSDFVASMYREAGVDADRVHVVPNGVDLDRFRPDGPALDLGDAPDGLRLLFVGGALSRKGIDVLLASYREAFAGREDVTLVVKDFGMNGVYRGGARGELERLAEEGSAPRVVHLTDELDDDAMAALYRSCDVLVHPYRGEGFAMPVLEAMASGLPVVVTAGGPTDEFCPDAACWRIRSARKDFPADRVDDVVTAGRPWMLEPDAAHLRELLLEVAGAGADELRSRGAAGREAAQALSWEAVASQYAERVRALAARPLRRTTVPPEPADFEVDAAVRVLATPAWRGEDRLGELLAAWVAAAPEGTDAVLALVADPSVDGTPEELEARVLAAAADAGVELECADIELCQIAAHPARDAALHAAATAYVPLHGACAGHERLARATGVAVVEPTADALRAILARTPAAV